MHSVSLSAHADIAVVCADSPLPGSGLLGALERVQGLRAGQWEQGSLPMPVFPSCGPRQFFSAA